MDYTEFLEEWRAGADCITCRTSGSTGTPKTISLPRREMIRSAERTIGFFGLDSGSRLHSCISPDYIGGKMMAVRSELTGAKLTWEEPSNNILRNAGDGRIDLLAVVPSQMISLLERLEEAPEIRNIIIGGSAINNELYRRICESGLNAWETYGMTETASHIALRKVAPGNGFFTPLPGITVSLDDEGRLQIEMKGWQRLVTNDLAEINGEGGFRILGRYDNMIVSGAKKINPVEVESIIEPLLDAEVLITSEPDLKWGERVVMIVEKSLEKEYPEERIFEICRTHLRKECVPKRIIYGEVPHTANMKKARKKREA